MPCDRVNELVQETLRECIDFGRNYADKHHHGKEEKILFRIMMENMGPVADKLIRNGMLVEGYGSLLKRHIGKEDEAAYAFAARALLGDKMNAVDNETEAFEKQAKDLGIQEKYESWIRQKIK